MASRILVAQRLAVLITSLHLAAGHDYLYIVGALSGVARHFTGEWSSHQLMEVDEMGVDFLQIRSSQVNITFVSDGYDQREGFELQVFPLYRTYLLTY